MRSNAPSSSDPDFGSVLMLANHLQDSTTKWLTVQWKVRKRKVAWGRMRAFAHRAAFTDEALDDPCMSLQSRAHIPYASSARVASPHVAAASLSRMSARQQRCLAPAYTQAYPSMYQSLAPCKRARGPPGAATPARSPPARRSAAPPAPAPTCGRRAWRRRRRPPPRTQAAAPRTARAAWPARMR